MSNVICVSLILLSSCGARPCPRAPHSDATLALDAHRDARLPAHVLRAEARVDRRGGEGRVRGTVRMFVERPDHVRFDAMTQFGPAAVLTSDGARFALMDLRENRFFAGPTCPENIERLLGVRMSGEEVARLLLGDAPRIEASEQTIRCEGGVYFVTLRAEDGTRQELELALRDDDLEAAPEQQRLRIRRSEVFGPGGTTLWRVTYGDHRFVEDPTDTRSPRRGVVMPFSVRFEDPVNGVDTLVRFADIDLNVEVPQGVFQQEPRPGLTVEPVTCH